MLKKSQLPLNKAEFTMPPIIAIPTPTRPRELNTRAAIVGNPLEGRCCRMRYHAVKSTSTFQGRAQINGSRRLHVLGDKLRKENDVVIFSHCNHVIYCNVHILPLFVDTS